MTSKQDIRKAIAAERKTLDPNWIQTTSLQIADRLQTLGAFQSAETVGLYMAIGGEVSLESLFAVCWQAGKRICIPVFSPETKRYEMAEIKPETPCRTGRYGIREPIAPSLVPMNDIDLVAVPGVAFDRHGNRLGRGGGYYDRLLEGFRGHAVGVAFDFQLLPEVPTDKHDQSTGCIVTESKIFNF